MKISILSLFPEFFDSPFKVSIIKRAREKGLLDLHILNIREFAKDKRKTVDDRPYGGGPGMVLMAEPLKAAIESVRSKQSHTVYLSPQGKRLEASKCEGFAKHNHIILICGHYEGIDQRIIDEYVDEEISIGDFVLTSGCPAAVVFVDAIARFIPGTIGHKEAVYKDSFQNGIFEGPQYTRPRVFDHKEVPPLLLEGNHREIENWRFEEGLKKTKQVRIDLYEKYLDQSCKKEKEKYS